MGSSKWREHQSQKGGWVVLRTEMLKRVRRIFLVDFFPNSVFRILSVSCVDESVPESQWQLENIDRRWRETHPFLILVLFCLVWDVVCLAYFVFTRLNRNAIIIIILPWVLFFFFPQKIQIEMEIWNPEIKKKTTQQQQHARLLWLNIRKEIFQQLMMSFFCWDGQVDWLCIIQHHTVRGGSNRQTEKTNREFFSILKIWMSWYYYYSI